jgi:hypothetical protein
MADYMLYITGPEGKSPTGPHAVLDSAIIATEAHLTEALEQFRADDLIDKDDDLTGPAALLWGEHESLTEAASEVCTPVGTNRVLRFVYDPPEE